MRARSLRFAGVTDLVAWDGWLTTRDASVEVGAGRSTGLATETENGVTARTGVALGSLSSPMSLPADMERPNDNRGRGDDHHEQDEEHRQYLGLAAAGIRERTALNHLRRRQSTSRASDVPDNGLN